MFRFTKFRLSAALAAMLPMLAFADQAAASEHVVVLIDQSASMLEPSVGGAPRWIVARQLAVDTVLAAAADREFSLWTFQGTQYTNVVPFTDGASTDEIVEAIWDLPTPASSTPLAGSICDAVDALAAYKPTVFNEKRIELFSDGLENSTPHIHKCYGPNSADHSMPDPGSWEWKVFNMVRTGNPFNTASPSMPLIINADYLFEHEPNFVLESVAPAPLPSPMLRSASRSRTDFDVIFDEYELEAISSWTDTQRSRTLQSLRTEIPSPFVRAQVLEGVFPSIAAANSSALALTQSIDFFKKLTRTASHIGRYREFTSKMLRLPQLGDVTGDYCVNDADVAAVKAKFGATVSAGSLLDPNQDKVIDYFDYLTVMQNFGDGCPRN